MKKYIFIISLLTLTSCASPVEVHVFSRSISQVEIGRIITLLTEEGFKVTPNNIEVPEEIISHSLVSPPLVIDFSTIESIREALAILGYENLELMDELYDSVGNHSYSTNNLGLYLVNPDSIQDIGTLSVVEDSGINLSHVYFLNCEDTEIDTELSLFAEGVGIIETFEWDERRNQESSTYTDLEWQLNDMAVTMLFLNGESIDFQIEEFEGRDQYGRYIGINLRADPFSEATNDCYYSYINYD